MVEPERMPLDLRSCEAAVRKVVGAVAGRGGGAGRTAGCVTSRAGGTVDLGGVAGFAAPADGVEVAHGGWSSKREALTGLGGAGGGEGGGAGGAGGVAGRGGGVDRVWRTTGRAVAAEFPAPKNWLMLSALADGLAL